MEGAPLVRAAEYVRMSTEHQRYSIEYQCDAIRAYSARRGLQIVRTYLDAGRSGLRLERRLGLQQLLSDIESGRADFDIIVVYDVSRWGRFQDADEAASYEYRCRSAGVKVLYCAEPFENDGSIGSDVQKIIKRRMAAEFSRELSVKVHAGQTRLAKGGFYLGGSPGYGLSRILLDEDGKPKCILSFGQYKNLQSERVVLGPGPPAEVSIVNKIYNWFVNDGLRESKIAERLNERGITSDRQKPWTKLVVHHVLTNEKYIGNYVWNKVAFKLMEKRVNNEPSAWIRNNRALAPIVDPKLFRRAQAIIRDRTESIPEQTLLDHLRSLLAKHGTLSSDIIDDADGPVSRTYQLRFGTLLRAYELVGFCPERDYRFIGLRQRFEDLRQAAFARLFSDLEHVGAEVASTDQRYILSINREFTLVLIVAICVEAPNGSSMWRIRRRHDADITVAIRMNETNEEPRDYLIIPTAEPALVAKVFTDISHSVFLFDSLQPILSLAARTRWGG
jgi:DNA invertase Pin-like site-specific DNA recombinase